MVIAVVNIDFTSGAFVSRQAFAAKATFFQHGAGSVIAARISVASINHVFAVLTVVAWSAATFILSLILHRTLSVVLAWECIASVAFRQNLITDFLFADELVGRRRQDEFVLHSLGLGASSDARLDIIQFHPFREPFE